MQAQTKTIRANNTDIHYVEQGSGAPLVLLHGGLVSTNPIWTGNPFSYSSHVDALSEHFRVIAPDTRGCGRTRHPGGPMTFDVLADDVLALIDALGLDHPRLCGFSEGGTIAMLVGLRRPGATGAIVNDAGHDLFDPGGRSFAMLRQMFGGRPDATTANPEAMREMFARDEHMSASFRLMQADQDGAQGEGYWKQYLKLAFERFMQWPGYTFDHLKSVTAPTLILCGDRDHFCSIEDGALALRALPRGELAIAANTGHMITAPKVRLAIEFLRRAH
jgi:pimeloyl-ACP methyl ester carboxylesterase